MLLLVASTEVLFHGLCKKAWRQRERDAEHSPPFFCHLAHVSLIERMRSGYILTLHCWAQLACLLCL